MIKLPAIKLPPIKFPPIKFPGVCVAAALAVAAAAPASANTHRDAVENACVADGGARAACSCLADAYAAELSDAALAFYARLLSRSDQPGAMAQIAAELGLSTAEVGAVVRRQREVDAQARRSCGL